MKGSLTLCLSQTLLLLFFQNIKICHADDLSTPYDLERSYNEERSRNNRAFGSQAYADAQAQAVSQYQNLGYNQAQAQAEAHAHAHSQSFGGFNNNQAFSNSQANAESYSFNRPYNFARSENNRANGEPESVGRSESLREPLTEYIIEDRRFIDAKNGDNSEDIDVSSATSSNGHTDGDASNTNGVANNTYGSSNHFFQSNVVTSTSSADSCSCDGGFGASDEVFNFLCFSSKDGGKSFNIKYKGITILNLEDIVKAFTFYYDNMQVKNINFENNLNNENNFKHETIEHNKVNVDIIKDKVNKFHEGSLVFNTESKFDTNNEIKKSINKFKTTLENINMNTFNKESNKFNFDVTKNDAANIEINKKFNNNNKFDTHFGKNFNGNLNFNFGAKANIQALKKENEAQAKAFAQAKAIATTQIQAQAQAQAEAKAQAILQNQINAQAQAEAIAEAHAQVNSPFNVQNQDQTQTYVQTHASAFSQAQAQNQIFGHQINGQSQPFSFSDIKNNARPIGAANFGIGGSIGFNVNGGALAKLGTFGNRHGYSGYSMGALGASAGSGRVPLMGHEAADDSWVEVNPIGDYTGKEFNYPDGFQYEDNPEDSFKDYSVGYPGPIAYPAPVDSSASPVRLYDGHGQKEERQIFTPYGGSKPFKGYP